MTFPWDTGDPDFNSFDVKDKNRHTVQIRINFAFLYYSVSGRASTR